MAKEFRCYHVIVKGHHFDWLLIDVFAKTRKEAMRLAKKEVQPGEIWVLKLKPLRRVF